MADVRDYVAAEMENIARTLENIPPVSKCPDLSVLELAGVAALLHSFYNGIENVLKQVLQSQGLEIPQGDSWHRDLLALARDEGIITADTFAFLKSYLGFRHFFAHAYALDLQAPRLEALVTNAHNTFLAFQRDVNAHLPH